MATDEEMEIAIQEQLAKANAYAKYQDQKIGQTPTDEGRVDPAYGPQDAILDAGSLGATSLGRVGGEAAMGALLDSAIAGKAAGIAGGVGANELYRLGTSALPGGRPFDPLSAATEGSFNSVIAPAVGKAASTTVLGPDEATPFMASDPAQRAVATANRMAPATDASGTILNKNSRQVINAVQRVADQGPTASTGQALGVGSGNTITDRGLAAEWAEKSPAVINDPIFQTAQSPTELATQAKTKALDVRTQMNGMLMQLDQSGARIDPNQIGQTLQPLIDLSNRLNLNDETRPFGQSLANKIQSLQRDLIQGQTMGEGGASSGLMPSTLDKMNQNLNLYRRTVLDEFSNANQATATMGGQTLGLEEKVATEAFGSAQQGISQALDELTPQSPYSQMNAQYGGYSTVATAAERKAYDNSQALASRSMTRVVQPAGNAPTGTSFDPSSPTATLTKMAVDKYNSIIGNPNDATQSLTRAVNQDSDTMANIRDLQSLGQNPAVPPSGNSSPILRPSINVLGQVGASVLNGYLNTSGIPTAKADSGAPATVDASQSLNDLLLQQPQPILSRNWDTVNASPEALAELDRRATMLGIVPPGSFAMMSDPQRQAVHKGAIQAMPNLAETVPGNLNIINGQYQSPVDKDTMMSSALDLSASERARVIGAMFQNKYQPINSQSTPPISQSQQKEALPVTLDRINNSLGSSNSSTPTLDSSYDGSLDSMQSQLERMTALHTQVQ